MTTATNNYSSRINADLPLAPGAYPVDAHGDNHNTSSSNKYDGIGGDQRHNHVVNDRSEPTDREAVVAPYGSSALGGVGTNPTGALLVDETPSPAHPFYPSPIDGTHKIHNVNHDEIHPFFPNGTKDQDQLDTSNDNTPIHERNLKTHNVNHGEIHPSIPNDNTPIHERNLKTHNVNHGEIHPSIPKEKRDKDRFGTSNDISSTNNTLDNKPSHIDIPSEVNNTKPHNYLMSRGAPMAADTKDWDDTGKPLHPNEHQGDDTYIPTDNIGHHDKVTKKEKVGTALQKTMGTVKETIGKIVKNENLVEKGAQQKENAEIKQKLRAIDQ